MLGHVCQETTRRVLGYALTSMKPLIRKQKQRQKAIIIMYVLLIILLIVVIL